MEFLDQHGRVIINVADDVTELAWPRLDKNTYCPNLNEGLKALRCLNKLRYNTSARQDADELQDVSDLTHISQLSIGTVFAGLDLQPLSKNGHLNILYLLPVLNADISQVFTLTQIKDLMIDGTPKNIKNISNLVNLESLGLTSKPKLDISELGKLKKLQQLSLVNSRPLDFTPISQCEQLTFLNCSNTKFTDLSLLNSMPQLRELILLHCRELTTLAGIKNPQLQILRLGENQPLPTLRPLLHTPNLEALYLDETLFDDGDVAVLAQLTKLRRVTINREYLPAIPAVAAKLPQCRFYFRGKAKESTATFALQGPLTLIRHVGKRAVTSFTLDVPLSGSRYQSPTAMQEFLAARLPADVVADLKIDPTFASLQITVSSFELAEKIIDLLSE